MVKKGVLIDIDKFISLLITISNKINQNYHQYNTVRIDKIPFDQEWIRRNEEIQRLFDEGREILGAK
jgi:hypothetical protein